VVSAVDSAVVSAVVSAVASAIAGLGCGETFHMTGDTAESSAATTSLGSGGTGQGGAVTSGSASGTAGSGGQLCDPVDDDGDGYSECDGDCDDTLDFVHPGALEICGDGLDENCDGATDLQPPCGGLGTFVSQLHGKNGAPGTLEEPVATIAEGIQRALQIGVPTAILVAAGQYAEDVTLSGSMSLLGGYDPESWSIRDPEIHVTKLKNTSLQGLKIAGAVAPLIVDGFTIEAPIVSSGNQSSIAVTIDGGSPTLSHNTIASGPVDAGIGQSVGVSISSSSGLPGGVILFENTIKAGSASTGPTYGVHINAKATTLVVIDNQISAAKGADSIALLVTSATTVEVSGNKLQSGTATGANSGPSTSLGVWIQKGKLILDANTINADQIGSPPKCFTPLAWCGGVRISAAGAVVTNNVIFGSSSDFSAGIALIEETDSLAEVVVSSNLILASGQSGIETTSAAVLLGSPRPDAQPTVVGRFRNNIFSGGFAVKNYGFWEARTPAESCDPAALDHNLFFFPANGTLYGDWDGAMTTNLTTLGALPGDGQNLFEDPKLSGTHIKADSPCRNKGTDADSPPTDLDQEDRPQEATFDIGPDEIKP